MLQSPCIPTTLEKFCTEAGSQDSLYLIITLAGGVVIEEERFLFFEGFFLFVCGWLVVGFFF